MRSRFTEGRAWLTQLAALPDAPRTSAKRAVALAIAASLARRQGSFGAAQEMLTEVLPALRQAQDPLVLEMALLDLGSIAIQHGDAHAAQSHLEESLVFARPPGHRVTEALILHFLGHLAATQEAYSTAQARAEESIAVARGAGDSGGLRTSLYGLGYIRLHLGDLAGARQLIEQALVLQRQADEPYTLSVILDGLGAVAAAQGHSGEARSLLRESLLLHRDLGDRVGIAESLDWIAAVAAADAQFKAACRLAGAAASLREAIGVTLHPQKRTMLSKWLVPLEHTLGMETTRIAWEEGRAMPEEQALDLALALTEPQRETSDHVMHHLTEQRMVLTPREQEVAALLAAGLSNRQIPANWSSPSALSRLTSSTSSTNSVLHLVRRLPCGRPSMGCPRDTLSQKSPASAVSGQETRSTRRSMCMKDLGQGYPPT